MIEGTLYFVSGMNDRQLKRLVDEARAHPDGVLVILGPAPDYVTKVVPGKEREEITLGQFAKEIQEAVQGRGL
jgi:hypothetical protein